MNVTIWEGEITRQHKINRLPMNFEDYTDWLSNIAAGRIDPIHFGNYILVIKANGDTDGLVTVENELIEAVGL